MADARDGLILGAATPERVRFLLFEQCNFDCTESYDVSAFASVHPLRNDLFMQMTNPLEKEFKFFLEHQNDLVKKYNGRYVVIKDGKVIGDYAGEVDAIRETTKHHELGSFLVQKCEPGSESYTQTFHSRVAVA